MAFIGTSQMRVILPAGTKHILEAFSLFDGVGVRSAPLTTPSRVREFLLLYLSGRQFRSHLSEISHHGADDKSPERVSFHIGSYAVNIFFCVFFGVSWTGSSTSQLQARLPFWDSRRKTP